jgi:hypothetical protein
MSQDAKRRSLVPQSPMRAFPQWPKDLIPYPKGPCPIKTTMGIKYIFQRNSHNKTYEENYLSLVVVAKTWRESPSHH